MLSLHDKTRRCVCGVGVVLVVAAVAERCCCCRRCSCVADLLGRVHEGRKDEGLKERRRRSVRVGA